MKTKSTICTFKYNLLRCISLSIFSLFVLQAHSQAIWTIDLSGATPNSSNPFTTSSFTDPDIYVSGIGRGTGINGSKADNRYNANNWNASGLDTGKYFYFTIQPEAGHLIDFTDFIYTAQHSASFIAPRIAFRSSIDSFKTNIGVADVAGDTIDLSFYRSIRSPVTFRLYIWNAAASSSTFSINSFTFRGSVSSTLPVTLTNFEVTNTPTAATLKWTTATEINNDHFKIERSDDGKYFTSIGSIKGNGNHQGLLSYHYTDHLVDLSHPYYYRLKQVDFNGKYEYSSIVNTICRQLRTSNELHIYPNPVNERSSISYVLHATGKVTVIICNMKGEELYRMVDKQQEQGTYQLSFPKLDTGMYVVKVVIADTSETIRIIAE